MRLPPPRYPLHRPGWRTRGGGAAPHHWQGPRFLTWAESPNTAGIFTSRTLLHSFNAAARLLHAAALRVSWHSSASRPDSCSREFTPSLIRMCVKPICCRPASQGLQDEV